MDYEEALKYLYDNLPMYQRVGKVAFKKDLTNIRKLCKSLDNPQESFRAIHVAGTNGKGTVSHMLSSVLQEHGYKTGLYTSPHYVDFRERVRVSGELISQEYVADFVGRIRETVWDIQPSFFEISVAMAFDYFRAEKVAFAVIETGLGGRLDSTNIIHPVLSVITNIGLDHQQFLGSTVYEIAGEKAGIIKKGIPVVIGKYQSACDYVFVKKAMREDSTFYFASPFWNRISEDGRSVYSCEGSKIRVPDLWPSPFWYENVITVLESVRILSVSGHLNPDWQSVQSGFENLRKNTRYSGRWQVLKEMPRVLADSAHNISALTRVLRHLSGLPYEKVHFVIGFVKDKDVSGLIGLFPGDQKYYFVSPDIPRRLPVSNLLDLAHKSGLQGEVFSSVEEGIRRAVRDAGEKDLVYIGGSSFVVAEALAMKEI